MRLRMCEKSSTSRAPTSPLKGLAHLEITFLSHVNVRTIITWGPHSIHIFFENMAVPPH